jgi:hypothetical protein
MKKPIDLVTYTDIEVFKVKILTGGYDLHSKDMALSFGPISGNSSSPPITFLLEPDSVELLKTVLKIYEEQRRKENSASN